MAGRPVQPKSRVVGRYNLVVEVAKSQLGALWAGTTTGDAGLEARLVRRIALGGSLSQSQIDMVADTGRWATDFHAEQALPIVDVVQAPAELAMVTSYVPGETLRSLMRLANFKRESVPVRVALRVVLDACEALLAAERRAVSASFGHDFFYGSLGPDSVLIGADGTTRVTDLGVAAAWRDLPIAVEHADITAYDSPEQLAATGKPVDSRADVFTLGVMLWEMLSHGKRLFIGSSPRAVKEKVLACHVPEPALGKAREALDPAAQALLRKMLERDPRRRFRSINDLKLALENLDCVGLPVEVSDFVTTFAQSPLESRRRVLERALNPPVSASHPPPAHTATTITAAPVKNAPATAPAPHPPTPQPAGPQPVTPPLRPRAPVPAAALGLPTPATAPAIGTPRASLTPGAARPLPLPVQAKLGSRLSTPGMVPPPPVVADAPPPTAAMPPPPEDEVEVEDEDENDDDETMSVRAEDIMRALAVEDAPPESDERPTMRAPALPDSTAPRTPDASFSERQPPVSLPPGQTAMVEPAPTPPPAATTSEATHVPVERPGAALRTPVPAAVATQAGEPPKREEPSAEEGASARAPTTSDAQGTDQATTAARSGSTRRSDAPIGELPARQSSFGRGRFPAPLVAMVSGAALLAVIGLVYAFGGNDAPESAPSAEDTPQDTARHPARAAGAATARAADDPASGRASSAAPNSAAPPADSEGTDSEGTDSEDTDSEDTDSEDTDGEDTANQEASTKAEPAPVAQAPPRVQTSPQRVASPPAPAPRPRKPRKQLRAKRTFIPSGI